MYKILEKVRKEKPLIHHLTNWVTIYDCANIVKVLGASPVMAHSKEEVAEMAGLASALVLNIGTLTPEFVEAMKIASKAANKKGIPVVLDVCGAGATKLRDQKCFEILNETRVDIIKGNTSEVARIAGEEVHTRGVDAVEVEKNLLDIAKHLAETRNCAVVITGKEDIVAANGGHYFVKNGCEMMAHIVGTGCMAASVIGTFAAVEKDLVKAAAAGLCCFEVAAEIADEKSSGPGSFKLNLYDAVFKLDRKQIDERKSISEE
ncbi:MAG: hydroxyethylthiazole kinase [Elusimicrobia bacterium]|nr:hydroxyethylthiazole kinase [Elusimicrobiota bacterium]